MDPPGMERFRSGREPGTIILMYHRVCPDIPANACYFERGTAVTPERFVRQLSWLEKHCELLTVAGAWARLMAGENCPRPLCVLTFDDGYRDVIDHVVPHCAANGVSLALFPVTGHLGDGNSAVWVDRYYDLLHQARCRQPRLAALGLPGTGRAPAIDSDLRWWVRGPVKDRLHDASAAERDRLLRALSQTLDADWRESLARELYLTPDELQRLHGRGWEIGGHGVSHSRLTGLSRAELAEELAATCTFLDQLAVSRPRVLCYPDGRYDSRVQQAVASAGFELACTVVPGLATGASPPLELPRWLVRNTEITRQPWHDWLCDARA